MDCQWVEENLEVILADDLRAEQSSLARQHIQSCQPCQKEVQALIAIDPIIKKYFQSQLARAVRHSDAPMRISNSARWTLRTAAVAIVAIVFVLLLRTPVVNRQTSPVAVSSSSAPVVSTESSEVIKSDAASIESERAKPSPAVPGAVDRNTASAPVITAANAPAFLVADPAGYSHPLQDYQGFTMVIGLWSTAQPETVSAIERLYNTFGSNTKLRFLGISNQRGAKPVNTTFPVFYNQGSRLFDAKIGDFVLVDESGTVISRGSLTSDLEELSKILRE